MTLLDAATIRDRASTKLVGREVIVVEETGSTNDLLFEMADSSAEGLVIFAESQTAGRGQRGNRWISPARLGLWFSILLHPSVGLSESPRMTNWLAEQIGTTMRAEYRLDASVKPPNDVYVGASKIAGVLLEMRAIPGASHVAIAGVGINVNQRVADFPQELRGRAASLRMLLDREIDRNTLAIALLRDFDRSYRELFG